MSDRKKILGVIAAVVVVMIGGALLLAGLKPQPDWDAYNDCFAHTDREISGFYMSMEDVQSYCADRYHIPAYKETQDSTG